MSFYQTTDNEFYGSWVEKSGLSHQTFLGRFFRKSADTKTFLDAVEQKVYFSDSYSTHRLELYSLSRLGSYFRALKVKALPKSADEWQKLVDDVYEHHFLQEKYTLRRLTVDWTHGFKPIFDYLRAVSELIPRNVKIPPEKNFRLAKRHGVRRETIIDGNWSEVSNGGQVSKVSYQLLNLDISRTDAQYLEDYRNALTRARSALETDARAYLDSMAAHFEYGQKLLEMCGAVQAEKLRNKFSNDRIYWSGYHVMRKELEPDNSIGGTDISLARILRFYETTRCLKSNIRETFNEDAMLPNWNSVSFPDTAPAAPTPEFSIFHRFHWLMGYITPTDLSVVHLYISLRNPKFNPMPLFDSELNDKLGRSNFSVVVDGISYVVNKKRVPALKTSSLDEESVFAIDLLLRMTRKPRKAMADDNPLKNRLFFHYDELGPRPCHYSTLYSFNGRDSVSLLPRSIEAGVPARNVSPMRIRRSTAVLEWLRTGSVTQAARKIGNTTRVVIRNYIPQPLIAAWNARLTRRYQNLLIVVAASKEKHLLASTDFSSFDAMKTFIEEMLRQHAPSSSKLAQMLHEKFDHSTDSATSGTEATAPNGLVVPIDAERLAVMYAFRDHNYAEGIPEQHASATHAKVIPNATLINLIDLLDTKLPEHHDPVLRRAHYEAKELAPRFVETMRSGSIATIRPMESGRNDL